MNNTNSSIVEPKKILVTGANGQVGSEISVLSDQYPSANFLFYNRDAFPLDDLISINEKLLAEKPDILINCGAYTAVDAAETDQENAYLINAYAVEQMAATCKAIDCRFIHISTDYVFNGQASTPYTEQEQTNPVSIYGTSKQKGEALALAVNPDSIIVRTAWVYSSFGKNFVKTILRLLDSKPEIGVVNDQIGTPTYAADLAEALLVIAFAENAPSGIYHYTNEGVISWYDLALAIKEFHPSLCIINPIPTAAYPTPAKRPAYSVLSTSRIFDTYPTLKKHFWKDSLQRCLTQMG